MRRAVAGLGVAMLLGGCEVPPEAVAERYVVAREHGHARQAYGMLCQADRDVRAYRDFKRRQVVDVEERIDRLLARRTKVTTRLTDRAGRGAKVRVDIVRVDVTDSSRQLIAADLKSKGPGIASRLQKADLPTRTSTETVTLLHEGGAWRVFLDLPTKDRVARQARLESLKRRGRLRMHEGQLAWATELYEAAAELAPDDTKVKHALRVLGALTDEEVARRSAHQVALAYRSKVGVSRIKVVGRRVTGEVRNTGDRALDEIELLVIGLDREGAPITQVTVFPVRRAPRGDQAATPRLSAGLARRFAATFDDPPAGWTGKVKVRVVQVRLATPSSGHHSNQ